MLGWPVLPNKCFLKKLKAIPGLRRLGWSAGFGEVSRRFGSGPLPKFRLLASMAEKHWLRCLHQNGNNFGERWLSNSSANPKLMSPSADQVNRVWSN